MIALDTCSDVSTGLIECLTNVRSCPPVLLHHLGGVTTLDRCGDVVVVDRTLTVFVVSASGLPDGVMLLFGMPEIVKLDISLDFVVKQPNCSIADAFAVRADAIPEVDASSASKFHASLVPLFWFIVLLCMLSSCIATLLPDFGPGHAMLPSSANGHSLFDFPPFAEKNVSFSECSDEYLTGKCFQIEFCSK